MTTIVVDARSTQAQDVLEPSTEPDLEQTVLPGPGLVLLDPSPRDRYQNRLADAHGSVSELYQANARWRRGALLRLPSDAEQQALRRWFLSSRRTFPTVAMTGVPAAQRPALPFERLPAPLAHALRRLAVDGHEGGLLYPADVSVAVDGWLHLLPPNGDHLVRERRMPDAVLATIVDAVAENARPALGSAHALLFVSVVPWRLEVTHGPRGYRNALLETGVLIGHASAVLARAGLTVAPVIDFVDTAVDTALDQDGVERFCVAILAVGLPADRTIGED